MSSTAGRSQRQGTQRSSWSRDPQRRNRPRPDPEEWDARARARRERRARARPHDRGRTPRRPRRPLTLPTRRQALRRRTAVLGVLVALLAAAVVLLFSPVLGVRSVQVNGNHVLSARQVRQAAALDRGTPMLRVDTGAVADRVAALPPVASVRVSRSWPSTVAIEITERTPVAVYTDGDDRWLVDRHGVPYLKAAATAPAPKGLPAIDLPQVGPHDIATRAVVTVSAALPPPLRAKVRTITASSQGDVRFTLRDGRQVKWGSQAESARKAAVLKVLLTRKGHVYNVISPDLPGVS